MVFLAAVVSRVRQDLAPQPGGEGAEGGQEEELRQRRLSEGREVRKKKYPLISPPNFPQKSNFWVTCKEEKLKNARMDKNGGKGEQTWF